MIRTKIIGILLCMSLLLSGCGAPPSKAGSEKFSAQVFAMNTLMDMTVFAKGEGPLEEAVRLVEDLDSLLSATDPKSEIYVLNRAGTLTLSQDTAQLLEKALGFCRKTEGALDISIYPVVRAWGFTTDSYQIPPQSQLDSLLPQVDYSQILYSPADRVVSLAPGMEIDLGSVAKGYTGDRLVALFREQGITSALLNLGGNVQALGAKPDGSPWKVGIRDPQGQSHLGVLSMENQAVITSGGYERYFVGEDGQVYWHIIDPATGSPARSGLLSATAVGQEGAYCDALSTALFIMGPEKAAEFWREHQDFDMILVTEDGKVLITPDLLDRFSLTEDAPYELAVIEK